MKMFLIVCAGIFFNTSTLNAQKLTKASSSSVNLKLNQRFYNSGEAISAKVTFKAALPVYNNFVVFVSPRTGDAEGLEIKANGASEYITLGQLKVQAGIPTKKNDGLLSVQPGEVIVAYYYNTELKAKKQRQGNQPDVVCEFAFIRDGLSNQANFSINNKYAMSKDEAADNASTILVAGEVPVQIERNRLIYYSKNQQELGEFVKYSNCKIIATMPGDNSKTGQNYLVEVPVNEQNLNDLGQLRKFLGFKQKVFCSSEDALKLVQFCALANLDGYTVSLNPRLQFNKGASDSTFNYFINPPDAGEEIPASFTQGLTDIRKVWNFMAIWDMDTRRVNVGIIDMGFHTNPDYRNAATMRECVADATTVRCSPGAAQGLPTVGASFFGPSIWHGNGVVSRIAGVLNNGFGTAGTGGQVAVPILIKVSGAETYAFNIGGAIRSAVNNGAQVINLSAGFPCRALTSLGDFTYCEPGVRTAICAALFPIVSAGSIIACSALGWIPFAGPVLVGVCIAAVNTAYIAVCVAQIGIGNPADVMSSAIQFAKSRGVPLIASAGNILSASDLSSVPAELIPFINLDPNRMKVEEWNIVPAMLADVICVGAAHPTASTRTTNFPPFIPFGNNQVFGNRVDIWAPEDGKYFAPERADVLPPAGAADVVHHGFGGTSASAPFITGLVANAMALNPQLNRNTSTSLSSIPGNILSLLTTTAWQNRVSLPDDPRRRNLVNPIAFLKAAVAMTGSSIPTFPSSVYGDTWNIDRDEDANDMTPTPLLTGMSKSGSIIMIPGADGAANIVDKDRFEVRYLRSISSPLQLRLRTPIGSRFGNLTIRGSGSTVISFISTNIVSATEEEKLFEGPPMILGTLPTFTVEGQTEADDNIYFLRVGDAPRPPTSTPGVITLTNIGELCPTTLVSGDREFGGGPLININAQLEITADESGIDAVISYRAEETGGDLTTATGQFRRRVFNAATGTRIVSISSSTSASAVVNFRGVSAGSEFGICNEGVLQVAPVTGGLIQRIVVVGDTGGDDVSSGGDCRCDTKIKSISFNPVSIATLAR